MKVECKIILERKEFEVKKENSKYFGQKLQVWDVKLKVGDETAYISKQVKKWMIMLLGQMTPSEVETLPVGTIREVSFTVGQ